MHPPGQAGQGRQGRQGRTGQKGQNTVGRAGGHANQCASAQKGVFVTVWFVTKPVSEIASFVTEKPLCFFCVVVPKAFEANVFVQPESSLTLEIQDSSSEILGLAKSIMFVLSESP